MIRVLILIFTLLGSIGFTYAETLKIVGDDNAMPKNWLNEESLPQGIMIDILTEVTKRTDIEFTYELGPWNRSLQLSKKGAGAIIGFSKTAERLKPGIIRSLCITTNS